MAGGSILLYESSCDKNRFVLPAVAILCLGLSRGQRPDAQDRTTPSGIQEVL